MWEFLEHLLKSALYRIHSILPPLGTFPLEKPCRARDSGIQFAEQPRNRNTKYSRQMRFDMICEFYGIEHLLTRSNILGAAKIRT